MKAIHRIARTGVQLAIVAYAMACGRPSDEQRNIDSPKDSVPPVAATDGRAVVMFVGTSLTAGYGLQPHEAFPARIQEKVDSAGLPFRIVNAGVSGETSAGALRRIDWVLKQGPVAVVVIETGANDGLRGLSIDSLQANLREIVRRASGANPSPRIVIAGMEALPNLGREYGQRFRKVFTDVATESGAGYLPFLLEGVAGNESLNQGDGVHPNAEGARRVAANVWRMLEPLLRELPR